MHEYHAVFGAVGVCVEIVSAIPYFRDIFKGNTKPHIFTWFGWGLVNTVVLVAQIVSGAGPGAFVTALISLSCFSAAFLALFYGEKHITKGDWACLIGSLVAIGLWIVTSNAFLAVIIVSIADLLAFIPTFRKAYWKPHEETLATFSLGAVRDVCAILALDSLLIVNWLYPATLLLSDSGFSLMLIVRRRQLDKAPQIE